MNEDRSIDHPDIPNELPLIQETLLEWYRLHARDLPWRHTRDPYRIMVSEIMLQQTQVDRVIPKYHAFLDAFPTVESLADAATSDVIRLWSGLGYNRRAVNLQRAAGAVVDEYNGEFPTNVERLKRLPGIGPYTAGAIACFAFEQDVGFLDTNIKRFLHRLFVGPEVPVEQRTQRQMQEIASAIVPEGYGWKWGQTLIEFGALQCTARKPACLTCPLQRHCTSFPDIQTALAELNRTGFRRKKEETFEGSNRFFRGRLLRALQEFPSSDQGIDLETLGPLVRDDYSTDHQAWMSTLVEGLQRDGLIEVAEESPGYDAADTKRIRLPGNQNQSN
jgi:A/G-specific adenine glycosylase